MHRLHQDERVREELMLDLDEIARQGARRMLAEALEAEVEAYIEAARGERDEQGHALVVRNGYAREREVLLGAGAVEVRGSEGQRPSGGRGRQQEEVQERDLAALHAPLAESYGGLAAAVSARALQRGLRPGLRGVLRHRGGAFGLDHHPPDRAMATEREQLHEARSLRSDYVYVWVDGIHTGVRLGGDDRLCCLVMVGARLDGTKELVAIADGYRESTESWACLLRDLKKRGMRAPELAVGDGALGFLGRRCGTSSPRPAISATGSIRPRTSSTRCQRASMGGPRRPSTRSRRPRTRRRPSKAMEEFAAEFGAKWPKAVSEDHRREGGVAHLLRLPGGALDASAHHQPDRVRVCSGEGEDRHDQRTGLKAGGLGDDLQADGGCGREVAEAKRASPGGAGESRSESS